MTKGEMLESVKKEKVAELSNLFNNVINEGGDFTYNGKTINLVGGSETINGINISLNACKSRGDDTCYISDSADVLHTLTEAEATELLGVLSVWGDAQWKNKKDKQIYVNSLVDADTDISKVLDVTWDSVEA